MLIPTLRKSLILLILLALAPSAWAQKQLVDRVVAVVNDEAVTQSEIDFYLRPLYNDFKQQYEGDELMRQLNEVRLKLLNQIIEDRLVYQEAKARGIQVEENEVDQMLEESKSKFPSQEEFENALLSQGMTLTELREGYRRQLSIKKLQDMEIRAHVVVSPQEIEDYYKNHNSQFAEEESVKVRTITIRKSEKAVSETGTDAAAKGKIEDIERRIKEGENFEKLATEFSEDANAKDAGITDWTKRGVMLPAIDEVIFKLSPGQISPIMETSMGYHLFKIEQKRASRVPPLEEVRESIHKRLFQEEAGLRFKDWMEELKKRAYISIR